MVSVQLLRSGKNKLIILVKIISVLFSKDYQCIALDLPGYGSSDALPENTFEAISHWLKSLIDEHGWDNPILVGNSYGGMIVQEFLFHYPTVAKMV